MRRWIGIMAAATLANGCATANLSPAGWPEATRTHLQQGENRSYPQATRIVEGKSELVAGTLSPIAVHAGMEALRQGGTAADAAIATSLTQVATNLGSDVSYAGVVAALYYEARTGKVYALDAGWANWSGETDPASIPAADLSLIGAAATAGSSSDGRKTLVPGFMAGMEALHTRFGKLAFAKLLEPSIWYADNGLTITPLLATYFGMQERYLDRTPEGHAFAHPSGALPRTGDRFVQPELAATLKGVAMHGASYMYAGQWGQAYVAAVNAHGGKASVADLMAYKPTWSDPISVGFNGAKVYGLSTGHTDCSVLEALAFADAAKLADTPRYWTDPAVFRTYSDILRYAAVAFYTPAALAFERASGFAPTCAARTSPQYAAAVLPRISELIQPSGQPEAGHHSASVIAVDKWGSVAVVVHSINAAVWGDTGLVVGGVPVSNAGGLYKARLAQLKPGARLPNDMAPVIALKDGKPAFAVATIGSSLVPETFRQLVGLSGGVDLAELMAAPPLLLNFEPGRTELLPAGRYSAPFLDALKSGGLLVREEHALVPALRGTSVIARIGPDGVSSVEVTSVLGFADAR